MAEDYREQELLDLEPTDKPQGPVECLGMTFDDDKKRREYFLEKLREKLKEPEFREIEGFPIGEDEDIMALSDPPYYTACPNPFIGDFIKHYGKPYDPEVPYSKEPFAADVTSGKGDQKYYIHSYHTKVPPSGVAQFIRYYASDHEIILDCFAGSGMTAVGGTLAKGKSVGIVLTDLSVSAAFISYFHSLFRPTKTQIDYLNRVFEAAADKYSNYYLTAHTGWSASSEAPQTLRPEPRLKNIVKGRIKYTVWSDYIRCPECGEEMVRWEVSVLLHSNTILDDFPCTRCGVKLTNKVKGARVRRATIPERAHETVYDDGLRRTLPRSKRKAVLISYEYSGKRYEKYPDENDLECIRQAEIDSVANSMM